MCLEPREVLGWWTLDPLALGAVGLSTAVYTRGLQQLWQATGVGSGVRRRDAACFYLGQLCTLFALGSPLDRLSDLSFAAHMIQHELILVVAPPLVVLGKPVVTLAWAFGAAHRGTVMRTLSAPALTTSWRGLSRPLPILLLHGLVVWLWHIPSWFEAALRSEAIHALQHASFFATAVVFWWSMLRGRYGRAGYGLAAAFVFATAMHTSVLGALLTVSSSLWYPLYAARGAPFEIDALSDQQLAGLVMWIPAGLLLGVLALALFAAWLGDARARMARLGRKRTL